MRSFPETYRNLEILDDCLVTKDFYTLLLGMLMLFKSIFEPVRTDANPFTKIYGKVSFRILSKISISL